MRAKLIKGGIFKDHRGQINFVNDFDLSSIRRFYLITHENTTEVRAWQGHRVECKWFYCTQGCFLVQLVKIDDWATPSNNLLVEEYVLKAQEPAVLFVPAGYANGLQALEANSQIAVFSDFGLEESLKEKIRFSKDKWGTWR